MVYGIDTALHEVVTCATHAYAPPLLVSYMLCVSAFQLYEPEALAVQGTRFYESSKHPSNIHLAIVQCKNCTPLIKPLILELVCPRTPSWTAVWLALVMTSVVMGLLVHTFEVITGKHLAQKGGCRVQPKSA